MTRRGSVEAGGGDRGEADGAGADDRDDVAGLDPAVLHADLKAGGQDVGEHHGLLVADSLGEQVQGVFGVGDADVFGLGAVDQVPEDPADPGCSFLAQAVGVQAVWQWRSARRT